MNTISNSETAGYASRAYATAFSEWGETRLLEECGGFVLERGVPGSSWTDWSGCYPVFACQRPVLVCEDIRRLLNSPPSGVLTLSLVPDPLQDFDHLALAEVFPLQRRLSDHFVVTLDPSRRQISAHHRRKIRRSAGAGVELGFLRNVEFLADWQRLYDGLVAHAGITGLRRFSPAIFERMWHAPGTRVVGAWQSGQLIGADWYYHNGEAIYAHLSAYSQEGYAASVSYPMMDFALSQFSGEARFLDLGGVPAGGSSSSGLAYFKAGWSDLCMPAWFYGCALHPKAYVEMGGDSDMARGGFFPSYRRADFSAAS